MASETLRLPGASGRYAGALYDLALDAGSVDAVAQDLRALEQALHTSDDLTRLVASPLMGRMEQARALDAVLAKMNVGALTRRFVGLLARNRRLGLLAQAIRDYLALAAHARGEMTAQVISAEPLSADQLAALKTTLQTAAQGLGAKSMAIQASVDPALLGGVIVKFGSRMIDASVRAKLTSLNRAMKGVG